MKKLLLLITIIFFNEVVSQNNNLGQNKKQFNNSSISNSRLAGQGYQQTQSVIALYDSVYNWHLDTATMHWKYTSKTTNYVYNSQQYQISYLTQKWNGTTWVNPVLDSTFYNAYNKITNQVQLKWNGATWVDSTQYPSTYDTSNNPLTGLRQNWNGSAWVNSSLIDFTFDNYHHMKSVNTYTWNSTAWVNTEKLIHSSFSYDANNNIITDNWQVWGAFGGPPPFLDTYTYNSNNYVTSDLTQTDDPMNGWVNQTNITYHYINNTELDSETVLNWHNTGGIGGYWAPSSLNVYTYDGNSNRLTNLGQTYTGAPWTNSYLYTYTYDANNIEKSYTIKHFNNTGAKVTSGDSTVYYFNAVTDIKQIASNKEQINIYPNPAKDALNVELKTSNKTPEIKIFDVLGNEVISTKQKQIDVSSLQNGIYFVQVKTHDGFAINKVVIQR